MEAESENMKMNQIIINSASLVLSAFPVLAQAQFTFTTNDGTITITGYTGSSASVVIPGVINGFPVTAIGTNAFYHCNMTSVTIPNSVTSIDSGAFAYSQLISATIPNNVTTIGGGAFFDCAEMTNVTIGSSVARIGDYGFGYCDSLAAIYFEGNAPIIGTNEFENVTFFTPSTVYYFPGTSGWGSSFGGIPTGLWSLPYPLILANELGFGVHTNTFGFTISWAANTSVVVEACTNLANSVWVPVQTNTLPEGWSYFSDTKWTKYPVRLYRLRSP